MSMFETQSSLYPLSSCSVIAGEFFPELICASSRRSHGNMSLSCADTRDSLKNRNSFLSEIGVRGNVLVCAKQIHSSRVCYAGPELCGSGASCSDSAIADTDAFITDQKNVALSVMTADCLSIFLYDPKHAAAGVIHAGWKGTREGIVSCTVTAMRERFGSRPQDLYAKLNPAIKHCCYEVGPEFAVLFPDFVQRRDGKYYFDIIGQNKKELLSCGVSLKRVEDASRCTACHNDDFFSFRREKSNAGRMMSVIMLK